MVNVKKVNPLCQTAEFLCSNQKSGGKYDSPYNLVKTNSYVSKKAKSMRPIPIPIEIYFTIE